jgi:hypothetical protein
MKYLCQVANQYISLKLHYIFKSKSVRKYLETIRSVKNLDSHTNLDFCFNPAFIS